MTKIEKSGRKPDESERSEKEPKDQVIHESD